MFSREYTSALLILVEFLEKGHEICHFWAISQFGTGTQIRVVSVPIDRTKVVPVPRQSGTGTHLQNRVGINTDQSGTDWYRYQDKVVPVPTYRIGLVSIPIKVVPVPIKVVPVPMLLAALIVVLLHC